MTGYNINVPMPVLTVDTDYDSSLLGTGEVVAQVKAGGVVVFEQRYTQEYVFIPGKGAERPDNFVHDDDDAVSTIIEAFGKRLKEVLA